MTEFKTRKKDKQVFPVKATKKENRYIGLQSRIEDILLEFAELYNEVTTSDLQGIATVKANEIIKEVKNEVMK